MSKMRDNMPAILVGLAILFVAMIVFEWGMNITGRQGRQYESNIVGKVNGQEITYPEFEKVYQNAVDNYKASTKQDPNDQMIAQLRNQVWDGLVNQILIKQAAKRLGIIVTDQEIVDWVTNSPETLPDVIRKNFEDSTGQVNRQILQAALASNRPEVQQFWKNVQDYLKEQLLQDKLTSRLYSAVRIPEGELRMQFAQQNEKLNTGYVLFQPALLYPDSGIHVTESEMRDYYSAHQEDYRTQSTRRLKFILLPLRPSAGDSSDVQSEINRVASLARSGTDFLELVKEYSETPYNDKFISHGQLEPSVETKAFSGKKGDIIGPFVASDGYHLIKIMDEQNGKNEYIHAAHILIHVPPGPDSTAAYKLADNILKQARSGADFAALAKQYSQDPGSAQLGGDLGWFGKGMMVKPFEDAAFKARVGQVVGPVRTQFGLHIIKVLGKDSRELKIADIKMSIKVSQQTKDDLKQRAEDFIYLAKQDGFDKAANTADVNVNQTPAFTKGKIIPGLGNYEDVVKWAFDGKLGDISEVMTLNQGYAVFMISEIKDASVTPFDQVAFQIKNLLTRKKQFDMAQTYADQLRQKLSPSDSLSKLPQFDSRLRYSVTGPFSPATFVPGVGRDFNFMAEAAKLNVGQISQAVKGNMGVFIIQLLSKTPFDTTAYKIQRMTMMQQLMQQEKSNVITNWLQGLKEKASIEDNRAKIFR